MLSLKENNYDHIVENKSRSLLRIEDSPDALDKHGPIFIIGCPRSGTTFLARCLSALNDMEMFVGVLAPPRLMHMFGSYKKKLLTADIGLLTRDIFWQHFWRRRQFRSDRLAQSYLRNKDIYHFLKFPDMTGVKFGYKEPFACFAAIQLAEYFPYSKFIHIIRDGRDAADSLDRSYPDALSDNTLTNQTLAKNKSSEIGIFEEQKGFIFPWWVLNDEREEFSSASKFQRYLMMWEAMVSSGMSLRSVCRTRYYEIRYEDLVRQPISEMSQILEFIGSDWNSRVRRRARSASDRSISIHKKRSQDAHLRTSTIKILNDAGYDI